MPIRLTGLSSGLDTEAIISALVSSYNYKTDKYKKAQTKLSWKQDAWKQMNIKIKSLYDSVGNMRFSTAYNMKKASCSDTTKVTAGVSSNAVNGTYSIQVTSLAKAGFLTGAKLGSGTTGSTKMSQMGYTGGEGTISVNAGGVRTDIKVSGDSTINEVLNQMKDAGVNASFDEANGRIYISAKGSGKENDFSLTASNGDGLDVLKTMGIYVESDSNKDEYKYLNDNYGSYTLAQMKALRDLHKNLAQNIENYNKENTQYKTALDYYNANVSTQGYLNQLSGSDAALMKELASYSNLDDVYVDGSGNVIRGASYDKDNQSLTYQGGSYDSATGNYTDKYGNVQTGGTYVSAIGAYVIDGVTGLTEGADKLESLAVASGMTKTETTTDADGNTTTQTVLDSDALAKFKADLATMESAKAAGTADPVIQGLIDNLNAATAQDYQDKIDANNAQITADQATIANNKMINGDMTDAEVEAFYDKVQFAKQMMTTNPGGYSQGSTIVNAQDATIYVNGAEYTGSSNTFSINGLSITATGVTGSAYDPTETGAVTVTVNTDTDGIYDKIKSFFTQYNSLMNEMTGLYNASSSKGYEPLTNEEKDAMSDTEVEMWEEKIKASLLRRDGTLDGVMSAMTSAMSKGISINGKNYNLSTFGIKTLGYLNASENQQNAYHIDGDEDDISTSGNSDKLRKAIEQDPDTILTFMQELSKNLYNGIDSKMKASSLSSTYTVYNDKEMASEYSDYTTTIKKWEEKLKAQEDYYYKKFAAMETALSKLQSQTSSLSSLFGS